MGFYVESKEIYKSMTDNCEMDISEGGLIHSVLMPTCNRLSYNSLVADELSKMLSIEQCLQFGYYDLFIRKCAEEGIFQKEATTSTGIIKITGTKGSKLPANAIVSTQVGIQYTTNANVELDDTGIGYVNITASDVGSKYNCKAGDICILPIKYLGILSVANDTDIENGYDSESYEDMYSRYLVKVQAPPTSGNKAHYKSWCLECTGVGNAYVIPLWDKSNGRNGRGTVKCVIADSNRQGASQELIDKVKNYIDPYPYGEGGGQAPIGCVVTVTSASEINLNIDCKVAYNENIYSEDEIKTYISDSIESYLKSVAFEIKKIPVAKINALIMSLSMINDCRDLTVNGETYKVNISDEEIPILGTITLTKIEGE